MLEKTAAEKPAVVEKADRGRKPLEKSADKPAETASIPAETRRHAPAPREREKVIAKSVTAPATTVAAPSIAAPRLLRPSAAAEAASAPEEHRDANDLARAAIERLRGDGSPRPQEAARVPDAPRVVSTAPVGSPRRVGPGGSAAAAADHGLHPGSRELQRADGIHAGGSLAAATTRAVRCRRPTFRRRLRLSLPHPRPLDLRAEAGEPQRREHTNVAEDMLLAAKSVFHAVLPK